VHIKGIKSYIVCHAIEIKDIFTFHLLVEACLKLSGWL